MYCEQWKVLFWAFIVNLAFNILIQEVKQVRNQLNSAKANTQVEVQCQLADCNQDLLMEITALRAKIAEMREISLTQERDIRERVREEYDGLVQNLFSSAFEMKRKYDEFRWEILLLGPMKLHLHWT